MKISLKAGERVTIIKLLEDLYSKGGLDLKGFNTVTKIIDKTEFSGTVGRKLVGLEGVNVLNEPTDECLEKDLYIKSTPLENGQFINQYEWNEAKDGEGKEIELTTNEKNLLIDCIQPKVDAKQISIGDKFLVSLAGKLGMIEE